MSVIKAETSKMSRAERMFREAFERLKLGQPTVLPRGTPVTQNNVAREAGVDPSALKKKRFPSLVAEIQHWIDEHGATKEVSGRQAVLMKRARSRDLRERFKALELQRDNALATLVEADARILELTLENHRLRAQLPASNVVAFK